MNRHSHSDPRSPFPWWIALLLLATGSPTGAQTPSFQVIVHADNPATEISAREVSKIFLGKLTRWPEDVSITPYDLAPDSPVRANFSREVHGKAVATIETYWQRMIFSSRGVPPAQKSPREIVEAVRALPGAIAYVHGDADLPPGVKRLSITEPRGESTSPSLASDREDAAPGDERPESSASADTAAPEGALLALAVSPASADIVWASFQDHGLWTTTNGGRTWAPAPSTPGETVHALAFDGVDSQLLLAGGEHGLYFSRDLGNLWQASTDGLGQPVRPGRIRGIRPLPQSSGTFFANTRKELLRSEDRGTTFTKLSLPGPPSAFTIDPLTGDLWLATGKTLQVSQDRGESWSRRADLSERRPVTQILIADLAGLRTLWVAAGRVLLRAELDREGLPGPLEPSLEQEVGRLYALDDTIYAATERGVLELANNGQRWELVEKIRDALLAADPFGSGRLYAGNTEGRIWRREEVSAPWRHVFDIRNPQPSQTTLYAVTEPPPPPPPPIPLRLRCAAEPGHVAALAIHPNALGVLWAASEHGVFRSEDGGLSWGPAGNGLVISDVHSLSIDPKTPTTLWAGTHGAGVHVSRDGGASWIPAPALGSATIHEVKVDPSVPDLLYASTPGGVFVSSDGGTHWRTLTALGERGHRLSTNDPAWRIAPRALAVNPDRPALALSDEHGRLFDVHAVRATRRSRPGLVSLPEERFGKGLCAEGGWRNAGMPEAHLTPELTLRDLTFAEDPHGVTVPWVATAFGVWRATDNDDAPWVRLPLDTNVAAVAIDERRPERVYAAAVDGLWRSTDAGATWERWGVREAVFSLAIDPGPSELVYAGLAGGRIASVRARSRPVENRPEPEVMSATVPPRLEEPVDPARRRGISSVLHLRRDPPPENTGVAFWQATATTPTTSPRLRALYAAEGLGRMHSWMHEQTRDILISSLQQIYRDMQAHGRTIPADLGLSPGGHWLYSGWRFDDGLRSHSEFRFYAPDEQGWSSGADAPASPGVASPGMTWKSLHDLALEPQHLRPSWLLEDPGPRLAWSHSGQFLATHGGPDRVLVWHLPNPVPVVMGRPPTPRVVQLKRGQDPRGAHSALSTGGNWMAVARHGGDNEERTAILSLWRLGEHAEQRTLDVLTRSKSDLSPFFTKLVFSGDARHLLGFREDGSAQVWPVRLRGNIEAETLPVDRFQAVYPGPRGHWLATVVGDHHHAELLLWPLRGPGLFTPISLTSGSRVSRVRFHPTESWLSALTEGHQAWLWDLVEKAPAGKPQEPPEVTLAASASGACAALFDSGGDWLTHERNASRTWRLRTPGEDGRLVRSERPRPRWRADGGTCRGLPRSAQDAGGLAMVRGASREALSLWNLTIPELHHLSGQLPRFGPAALHSDEGPLRSPAQFLKLWPEKPLKQLSDGALRTLACKVVGRPLSREEWSFAMGTAEYRPLCPPLPASQASTARSPTTSKL